MYIYIDLFSDLNIYLFMYIQILDSKVPLTWTLDAVHLIFRSPMQAKHVLQDLALARSSV